MNKSLSAPSRLLPALTLALAFAAGSAAAQTATAQKDAAQKGAAKPDVAQQDAAKQDAAHTGHVQQGNADKSADLKDTALSGETKANEASMQPLGDSWITTKVKADLLATEATKGLDINVTTTNGVVTLSGKLDSKVEIDQAVAVARAIKGVKSVDATTLTVKPRG